MVEGLAGRDQPDFVLDGTFAVCSLDIDFINSIQPEFDINIDVWNRDEVYQSRHLHFYQFYQYDLKDDLQLHRNQVFTTTWHFATTTTAPIWCVYFQSFAGVGGATNEWGGNVFQHPATGLPATVILPPIPQED
jgi:hypothetical protein